MVTGERFISGVIECKQTTPNLTGTVVTGTTIPASDNLGGVWPYNDSVTLVAGTGKSRPESELLAEGRVRIGDIVYRWHDGVFMWVVEAQ